MQREHEQIMKKLKYCVDKCGPQFVLQLRLLGGLYLDRKEYNSVDIFTINGVEHICLSDPEFIGLDVSKFLTAERVERRYSKNIYIPITNNK